MPAAEAPECNCCIEKRLKGGLEPLQMMTLPDKTTKRDLEVFVCPACDAPVLELLNRRQG